MKKLIFISTLFLLFSFSSKNDYTKNTFDKNSYQDKIIYFTLNSKSFNHVDLKGPSRTLGEFEQPDVKQMFIESINEIALETKRDLRYVENVNSIPNIDGLVVDVQITKILWSFGFSSAMNINANYKTNMKSYDINGTYKSIWGGRASVNLKKSLKNTTYNFLKEFDK